MFLQAFVSSVDARRPRPPPTTVGVGPTAMVQVPQETFKIGVVVFLDVPQTPPKPLLGTTCASRITKDPFFMQGSRHGLLANPKGPDTNTEGSLIHDPTPAGATDSTVQPPSQLAT
ncbi:hypothetical protein B0H11DRAFT_2232064 [Mycena galericulata]|nr:hypothetical protein B0H11DRAFT_2232064 [Mycena galericulata]